MKAKVWLATLMLNLLICALWPTPTPTPELSATPTATVSPEDLVSLPDPGPLLEQLDGATDGEIIVLPIYWLEKRARFFIMFKEGDEVYLAEFGYMNGAWTLLGKRLALEPTPSPWPGRETRRGW